MWEERTEYGEPPLEPPLEEYGSTETEGIDGQDDWEETKMPDVPDYQEVVFSSSAYEWLIANLRREFFLSFPAEDVMARIRQTVIQCLSSKQRISRKATSLDPYSVAFHVDWEPLPFFEQQEYGISHDKAVLHALTLTASSEHNVQCLPCFDYVRQVWPFTADGFAEFISGVLGNPRIDHECKTPRISISMTRPPLAFENTH